MEVGSSSLPGTTHRTIVQCAQVASLPGTTIARIYNVYGRHDNSSIALKAMWSCPLFKPLVSGGLAQLARALAWHARGHRFDPDILHFALDSRMRSLTY